MKIKKLPVKEIFSPAIEILIERYKYKLLDIFQKTTSEIVRESDIEDELRAFVKALRRK